MLTIEDEIIKLQNQNMDLLYRVQRLEQLMGNFVHIPPVGEGQRQINSDPNRTESGMGPLLNSNSEFI